MGYIKNTINIYHLPTIDNLLMIDIKIIFVDLLLLITTGPKVINDYMDTSTIILLKFAVPLFALFILYCLINANKND